MSSTQPSNDGGDLLGKELVWTPEVEHMGQQIAHWVRLDLPGGHIFGVQRNGKSSAIRHIAGSAQDFLGGAVFISILDVQRGQADREGSLVAEWLHQERVFANENTPARLKRRLFAHFEEQAGLRKTDRILLIIDEAQNCTRLHLGQLIYWGNLLSKAGFRVFTLLVGQPELRAFVDAYIAMKELQIVGRFFEVGYEFRGIALNDVALVLKAHESDVSCADGSVQPPAIAALFPEAWANGWRPSTWAPVMKEAITAVSSKAGLGSDERIPMQHLRSAFLGLLLFAQARGEPTSPIPLETAIKALTDTGLRETWAKYAAARRSTK